MTKANLIDHVARTTENSRKDAEQIVDAVFEAISGALERGEKVDLRGFGSFQVNGRKERQGRNPKTGETLTIAARSVAVFKPGKELTDKVNGRTGEAAPAGEVSEGSAKLHGDKINV